jgi:hypothetical protein
MSDAISSLLGAIVERSLLLGEPGFKHVTMRGCSEREANRQEEQRRAESAALLQERRRLSRVATSTNWGMPWTRSYTALTTGRIAVGLGLPKGYIPVTGK